LLLAKNYNEKIMSFTLLSVLENIDVGFFILVSSEESIKEMSRNVSENTLTVLSEDFSTVTCTSVPAYNEAESGV
jgi:hypothetical protein